MPIRRKNISPEMRDIKFPRRDKPRRTEKAIPAALAPRQAEDPPLAPAQPRKSIFLSVIVLILLVAAGLGVQKWEARRPEARLSDMSSVLKGVNPLGDLLSSIRDGAGAVGGIGEAGSKALSFADGVNELLVSLPKLMTGGHGEEALQKIKDLRGELAELNADISALAAGGKLENLPVVSDYFSFAPRLKQAETFLDGIIAWFEAPGPRHVIVIFGNTSELRPGGGFAGSFADIEVKNGNITNVAAHDVNDLDRVFPDNIVPPKPLQAIARRWRAADTNWFFDFPASAKKFLEFLDASAFYGADHPPVDGVVTITPKVLEDVIATLGPVALPDGKTITADNFMTEIQREVQAGQAEGSAGPKQILGDIVQAVQSKLTSLSAADAGKLADLAGRWISGKDMMVYFGDDRISGFLRDWNADGSLYPLSRTFMGDYLAPVHANVGGGKSDLVMTEKIIFESQLEEAGNALDHLEVQRTDQANEGSEWWYQLANQDYLQVFTPLNVKVNDFSGGYARTIVPRADYRSFAKDPDVARLESTAAPSDLFPALSSFEESGRNVLAAWVKTAMGETSRVKLDYSRRLPEALRDGTAYTLVFERQAGTSPALSLSVTAPPGYVWRENDLPVYEYKNDDPPGRIVLDLTLRKAE